MTSKLNLQSAGVEIDESSGKIIVDEMESTNMKGIYAIGDVALVSYSTMLRI